MEIMRVAVFAGIALAVPAAAEAAPAYSYDYSGQSMALTSSAIDNASLGTTARAQRRAPRSAAPRARRPAAPAKADAQTREACSVSTPILRSMGLQPAAECR